MLYRLRLIILPFGQTQPGYLRILAHEPLGIFKSRFRDS